MTDLLVGAVSIPFYAFLQAVWMTLSMQQLFLLEGILATFYVSCQVASIVHLCMISIDRALAVKHPFFHRQVATRSNVRKVLSVPWLTGIIASIPNFFIVHNTIAYLIYYTVLLAMFYVIPIVIISVSYINIFRADRGRNTVKLRHSMNQWKLARTMLIVILGFLLCQTPFIIAGLYDIFSWHINGAHAGQGQYWTITWYIHYLSSIINPFIYAIANQKFRYAYKQVFRESMCCKRESQRNRVRRSIERNLETTF